MKVLDFAITGQSSYFFQAASRSRWQIPSDLIANAMSATNLTHGVSDVHARCCVRSSSPTQQRKLMRRISDVEKHISSKLLSRIHPHTSGRAAFVTGLGSLLVPIGVICADRLKSCCQYTVSKKTARPLINGSENMNLFLKTQSKASVTRIRTRPAYCSVLQSQWLWVSCSFGPQSQDTQLVYWPEIWQHFIPPGEKVWQGEGVKTNLVPASGASVRLLSILLSSCLFSKHKDLLATRCQPDWRS